MPTSAKKPPSLTFVDDGEESPVFKTVTGPVLG